MLIPKGAGIYISIYLACWLITTSIRNGLPKEISAKARLPKDLGSIAPKCARLPLSAKASKTPFPRAWGSGTTSVSKLHVSVWCIPWVPRCSCRARLAGWFYARVGPQARHAHQTKQGGAGGANQFRHTRSCHGGLDVCSKPECELEPPHPWNWFLILSVFWNCRMWVIHCDVSFW